MNSLLHTVAAGILLVWPAQAQSPFSCSTFGNILCVDGAHCVSSSVAPEYLEPLGFGCRCDGLTELGWGFRQCVSYISCQPGGVSILLPGSLTTPTCVAITGLGLTSLAAVPAIDDSNNIFQCSDPTLTTESLCQYGPSCSVDCTTTYSGLTASTIAAQIEDSGVKLNVTCLSDTNASPDNRTVYDLQLEYVFNATAERTEESPQCYYRLLDHDPNEDFLEIEITRMPARVLWNPAFPFTANATDNLHAPIDRTSIPGPDANKVCLILQSYADVFNCIYPFTEEADQFCSVSFTLNPFCNAYEMECRAVTSLQDMQCVSTAPVSAFLRAKCSSVPVLNVSRMIRQDIERRAQQAEGTGTFLDVSDIDSLGGVQDAACTIMAQACFEEDQMTNTTDIFECEFPRLDTDPGQGSAPFAVAEISSFCQISPNHSQISVPCFGHEIICYNISGPVGTHQCIFGNIDSTPGVTLDFRPLVVNCPVPGDLGSLLQDLYNLTQLIIDIGGGNRRRRRNMLLLDSGGGLLGPDTQASVHANWWDQLHLPHAGWNPSLAAAAQPGRASSMNRMTGGAMMLPYTTTARSASILDLAHGRGSLAQVKLQHKFLSSVRHVFSVNPVVESQAVDPVPWALAGTYRLELSAVYGHYGRAVSSQPLALSHSAVSTTGATDAWVHAHLPTGMAERRRSLAQTTEAELFEAYDDTLDEMCAAMVDDFCDETELFCLNNPLAPEATFLTRDTYCTGIQPDTCQGLAQGILNSTDGLPLIITSEENASLPFLPFLQCERRVESGGSIFYHDIRCELVPIADPDCHYLCVSDTPYLFMVAYPVFASVLLGEGSTDKEKCQHIMGVATGGLPLDDLLLGTGLVLAPQGLGDNIFFCIPPQRTVFNTTDYDINTQLPNGTIITSLASVTTFDVFFICIADDFEDEYILSCGEMTEIRCARQPLSFDYTCESRSRICVNYTEVSEDYGTCEDDPVFTNTTRCVSLLSSPSEPVFYCNYTAPLLYAVDVPGTLLAASVLLGKEVQRCTRLRDDYAIGDPRGEYSCPLLGTCVSEGFNNGTNTSLGPLVIPCSRFDTDIVFCTPPFVATVLPSFVCGASLGDPGFLIDCEFVNATTNATDDLGSYTCVYTPRLGDSDRLDPAMQCTQLDPFTMAVGLAPIAGAPPAVAQVRNLAMCMFVKNECVTSTNNGTNSFECACEALDDLTDKFCDVRPPLVPFPTFVLTCGSLPAYTVNCTTDPLLTLSEDGDAYELVHCQNVDNEAFMELDCVAPRSLIDPGLFSELVLCELLREYCSSAIDCQVADDQCFCPAHDTPVTPAPRTLECLSPAINCPAHLCQLDEVPGAEAIINGSAAPNATLGLGGSCDFSLRERLIVCGGGYEIVCTRLDVAVGHFTFVEYECRHEANATLSPPTLVPMFLHCAADALTIVYAPDDLVCTSLGRICLEQQAQVEGGTCETTFAGGAGPLNTSNVTLPVNATEPIGGDPTGALADIDPDSIGIFCGSQEFASSPSEPYCGFELPPHLQNADPLANRTFTCGLEEIQCVPVRDCNRLYCFTVCSLDNSCAGSIGSGPPGKNWELLPNIDVVRFPNPIFPQDRPGNLLVTQGCVVAPRDFYKNEATRCATLYSNCDHACVHPETLTSETQLGFCTQLQDDLRIFFCDIPRQTMQCLPLDVDSPELVLESFELVQQGLILEAQGNSQRAVLRCTNLQTPLQAVAGILDSLALDCLVSEDVLAFSPDVCTELLTQCALYRGTVECLPGFRATPDHPFCVTPAAISAEDSVCDCDMQWTMAQGGIMPTAAVDRQCYRFPQSTCPTPAWPRARAPDPRSVVPPPESPQDPGMTCTQRGLVSSLAFFEAGTSPSQFSLLYTTQYLGLAPWKQYWCLEPRTGEPICAVRPGMRLPMCTVHCPRHMTKVTLYPGLAPLLTLPGVFEPANITWFNYSLADVDAAFGVNGGVATLGGDDPYRAEYCCVDPVRCLTTLEGTRIAGCLGLDAPDSTACLQEHFLLTFGDPRNCLLGQHDPKMRLAFEELGLLQGLVSPDSVWLDASAAEGDLNVQAALLGLPTRRCPGNLLGEWTAWPPPAPSAIEPIPAWILYSQYRQLCYETPDCYGFIIIENRFDAQRETAGGVYFADRPTIWSESLLQVADPKRDHELSRMQRYPLHQVRNLDHASQGLQYQNEAGLGYANTESFILTRNAGQECGNDLSSELPLNLDWRYYLNTYATTVVPDVERRVRQHLQSRFLDLGIDVDGGLADVLVEEYGTWPLAAGQTPVQAILTRRFDNATGASCPGPVSATCLEPVRELLLVDLERELVRDLLVRDAQVQAEGLGEVAAELARTTGGDPVRLINATLTVQIELLTENLPWKIIAATLQADMNAPVWPDDKRDARTQPLHRLVHPARELPLFDRLRLLVPIFGYDGSQGRRPAYRTTPDPGAFPLNLDLSFELYRNMQVVVDDLSASHWISDVPIGSMDLNEVPGKEPYPLAQIQFTSPAQMWSYFAYRHFVREGHNLVQGLDRLRPNAACILNNPAWVVDVASASDPVQCTQPLCTIEPDPYFSFRGNFPSAADLFPNPSEPEIPLKEDGWPCGGGGKGVCVSAVGFLAGQGTCRCGRDFDVELNIIDTFVPTSGPALRQAFSSVINTACSLDMRGKCNNPARNIDKVCEGHGECIVGYRHNQQFPTCACGSFPPDLNTVAQTPCNEILLDPPFSDGPTCLLQGLDFIPNGYLSTSSTGESLCSEPIPACRTPGPWVRPTEDNVRVDFSYGCESPRFDLDLAPALGQCVQQGLDAFGDPEFGCECEPHRYGLYCEYMAVATPSGGGCYSTLFENQNFVLAGTSEVDDCIWNPYLAQMEPSASRNVPGSSIALNPGLFAESACGGVVCSGRGQCQHEGMDDYFEERFSLLLDLGLAAEQPPDYDNLLSTLTPGHFFHSVTLLTRMLAQTCTCEPGFAGDQCQDRDCLAPGCLNEGFCDQGLPIPECVCPSDGVSLLASGPNCDQDVCNDHGTVVPNLANPGFFLCVCDEFYFTNALHLPNPGVCGFFCPGEFPTNPISGAEPGCWCQRSLMLWEICNATEIAAALASPSPSPSISVSPTIGFVPPSVSPSNTPTSTASASTSQSPASVTSSPVSSSPSVSASPSITASPSQTVAIPATPPGLLWWEHMVPDL